MKALFLVSLGRTGTTMAVRALAAHPAITAVTTYPCEVRVAQYWASAGGSVRELDPARVRFPELFEPTLAQLGGWPRSLPEPPGASWSEDVVDYVRGFYGRVAEAGQPEWFLEKLIFDRGLLDDCQRLFPAMRCALLVRDPRDMVLSMLAFNAARGTLGFRQQEGDGDRDLLSTFDPHLGDIARWWDSRPPGSLLLRYEDLVGRPRETLRVFFDALGPGVSEDVLQSSLASLRRRTGEEHGTTPSVATSSGRWRKELSAEARRLRSPGMVRFCEAFGYESPG